MKMLKSTPPTIIILDYRRGHISLFSMAKFDWGTLCENAFHCI